ncbi:keratin, type I cytoskeletal 10-like [Mytilus trossulus]|uniref:keratin, type I cytoskeletal 10-like n=1 Tax=Mytilus trossulus TaxID=6551 RepID=UPI00300466CF
MQKLLLLLVPCVLAVVLVNGYTGFGGGAGFGGAGAYGGGAYGGGGGIGGYGAYGGGGQTVSRGYPLSTYANTVATLNERNRLAYDQYLIGSYNNPNKWSFILPLALLGLLLANRTSVATTG